MEKSSHPFILHHFLIFTFLKFMNTSIALFSIISITVVQMSEVGEINVEWGTFRL